MGFMSGVITGVALAAGAAAWYMSRSGERFRDQYRVDRKLGELGDQLEARTREIQSTVNTQLAEMRAKADDAAAGAGSTMCRPPPAEAAAETPPTSRPAAKAEKRRQGRRGREGARRAADRTDVPARATTRASPRVRLARMCDGSLGSTSTSRGRPMQESQCENGKSRTRRPRPPTDPPPPRASRLIRPMSAPPSPRSI